MTEFRELEWSPRVRAGEAQIWRFDASATPHAGWPLLLPDEVERARRIRMKVAREEFVAGRAALRVLLGRELGRAADEVRLSTGAEGKPTCDGIDFNVAHAGGVVLIALSRAGAVGVDVEREDRTVEAVEIARGSFHAEEIQWIERAANVDRAAVFFRCWTRKEAVVKANGRGLSIRLDCFSVCDQITGLAELPVCVADYERSQESYYVRDLPLGIGLAGALACTRPGVAVTMHKITALNQLNRTQRTPASTVFDEALNGVTS